MARNIRKNQKIKKSYNPQITKRLSLDTIDQILGNELGDGKLIFGKYSNEIREGSLAIVDISTIVNPALVRLGEPYETTIGSYGIKRYTVASVIAYKPISPLEDYSLEGLINIKNNIFCPQRYHCDPIYRCRLGCLMELQVLAHWRTLTDINEKIREIQPFGQHYDRDDW